MALKYYSDRTQKFYNTAEEANRAEFELKEKENLEKIRKEREVALAKEQKEKEIAERKAAAEKVDNARKTLSDAYKAYDEARKTFSKELNEFCNKYKSYHYTLTDGEIVIPPLFDANSVLNLFKNLFKF